MSKIMGRPVIKETDRRTVSYRVGLTQSESKIAKALVKEKHAGSVSNLFRMLLLEN